MNLSEQFQIATSRQETQKLKRVESNKRNSLTHRDHNKMSYKNLPSLTRIDTELQSGITEF